MTVPRLLAFTAAILATLALSLSADALETIAVKDIEPGMKGYGLTVFSGTEPERFQVEVVDIVPNFLLKQDIILIRCSHPVTDKAGIIGGMSGSPIYIEGKLAGALAYGWRFHKEPIAGVTPIANMVEVAKRPLRKKTRRLPFRMVASLKDLVDRAAARGPAEAGPYFAGFANRADAQLRPAETPITLSGFNGESTAMLSETLAPFGMEPVAGGGSGGEGKGAKEFVPGGTIGVQLIRGDMNATGMGTVTALMGKSAMAFGHPLFNMGEGRLPVTTGKIHMVVASLARSNKLGSPLNVAGSLVHDRQACIVARTDQEASMIPVKIRLEDPRSSLDASYQVELASHKLLTGRLLHAALVNIVQNAASDAQDVTAEIEGRIAISERKEPLILTDSGLSRSGVTSLMSYFRPSGVVSAILANPFEDVEIESVEFEVKLSYGLDHSLITGAYLTASKPREGDEINLHVRTRAYGGEEKIVTVPISIPRNTAGEKLQIQVGGGDTMVPPLAAPRNLDEMLKNVQRLYPPDALVVSVSTAGYGIALEGTVLDELPGSAAAALRPMSGTAGETFHKPASVQVIRTNHIISGKKTISVTVDDRRNR